MQKYKVASEILQIRFSVPCCCVFLKIVSPNLSSRFYRNINFAWILHRNFFSILHFVESQLYIDYDYNFYLDFWKINFNWQKYFQTMLWISNFESDFITLKNCFCWCGSCCTWQLFLGVYHLWQNDVYQRKVKTW